MKVIGIDIDSTITSTGEKARECLAKFAPGCKNDKMLSSEEREIFLSLYEEFIHENCELKPGVLEAFRYFKENNYKIIIITARNNEHCKNQETITVEYFKRHNLQYDKIIFDKSKKGLVAKENNCDLFIDDKEENLDDISKYGIECLKFGESQSKYQTFKDWYDIIKYIKAK